MGYNSQIALALLGAASAGCAVSQTVALNETQIQADFLGCIRPIDTSELSRGLEMVQPCAAQTRERCESGDNASKEACFSTQNTAIRNYYSSVKAVLPPTIEGPEISVRFYQSNLSEMDEIFGNTGRSCIPALNLDKEHCEFVVFTMEFVDLIGAAVEAEVGLP